MSWTVADVIPLLGEHAVVVGDPRGKTFTRAAPITQADEHALVWANPTRSDKQQLVEGTSARIVICDAEIDIHDGLAESCFLVVANPKLAVIKVLEALFAKPHAWGVHPTAVVSPDATLGDPVFIGPNTYVGKSEIGAGTRIFGNAFIYDDVRIGKNVIIHPGCVIGGDGFGYERDETGRAHKFPHFGGVVIEDDVEIGAVTHVDRGALGDTIVRRGTKIDNCCHIAHNDDIGEDVLIVAHTMLGGSLTIGDRAYIGPSTAFRDGLRIGEESFVGMASLVVSDLPPSSRVMGAPARPIDQQRAILRRLKALAAEDDAVT
jgi:UDP-3-O-[3-hydroxymyristoyl] glucosamine N-acyltransferase